MRRGEIEDPEALDRSHVVAYRWFLLGAASWFAAWGMNGVVFAWLVVEVLDAAPRWVGIAQSASMLPAFAFLLVGGAAADRGEPRRMLPWLHLAVVLPIAALAFATLSDRLSLPLLLAYGATLGTIQAFVMPARDALLPRVAGPDLMRAVAGLTIFQFGGQAAGSLLAGQTDAFGLPTILALQAGIVAVGALGARGAPGPPVGISSPTPQSALRDIAQGIRTVLHTSALRIPIALVAAVGMFFIGPFLVAFPLLVSDVYGGGTERLGIVLMMFPLGTIAGSLALRLRGGITRKGQALLLALVAGAVTLLVLAIGVPFPAFVFGTFVWGLGGAIFINMSRTLAQQAAPDAQRGRVLAAYQVGFVGSSPLGAMLAGIVTEAIGPLGTLAVFGTAMLVVVAATAVFSRARELR